MKNEPLTHFLLEEVPGAKVLFDWFGYWPTFHDAEIVSLHLDRAGESILTVHTWEMTNKVDQKGFYILRKHVLVEFVLDDIEDLELADFNHQNVISELVLSKENEATRLTLGGCYGLSGWVLAKKLSIRLITGEPSR